MIYLIARILLLTGTGIFVFSITSRHIRGLTDPILTCLYQDFLHWNKPAEWWWPHTSLCQA